MPLPTTRRPLDRNVGRISNSLAKISASGGNHDSLPWDPRPVHFRRPVSPGRDGGTRRAVLPPQSRALHGFSTQCPPRRGRNAPRRPGRMSRARPVVPVDREVPRSTRRSAGRPGSRALDAIVVATREGECWYPAARIVGRDGDRPESTAGPWAGRGVIGGPQGPPVVPALRRPIPLRPSPGVACGRTPARELQHERDADRDREGGRRGHPHRLGR